MNPQTKYEPRFKNHGGSCAPKATPWRVALSGEKLAIQDIWSDCGKNSRRR